MTPAAETAALKHGLYSQRLSYLPCDVCKLQEQCDQYQPGQQCPLERAWVQHRRPLVAQAIQQAGRDPELHAAQITAAVHAEIRYHRNWGYMLVDGEVWPDPKQQGMLVETPSSKRVERLRREMDKAFEELGLSPRALAKLETDKQQGMGMAATILALGQPGALGAGEDVRDAEFEAAPEAPPVASDELRVASDGETATAEQDGQDGRHGQDGEDGEASGSAWSGAGRSDGD